MHTFLHNTKDKKKLRQEAEEKAEKRYTLSFYKYLNLKKKKKKTLKPLEMSCTKLGTSLES